MGNRGGASLRDWNFRTAGAWSVSELYGKGIVYVPVINMAASMQRDLWLKGGIVDYFSPEFREAADGVALRMCAPHAKDPWLLGYFTDNELRWGRDWRSQDSLLESYLKMPPGSPGLARDGLREGAGPRRDGRGQGEVSRGWWRRTGRVTSQAIRKHDPNHMVLGAGSRGIRAIR